ncbi:MAG: mechanosensitive ion channel [Flavobacteriales bacterium]|nr:mechanosensitive ion channel [Flavobacteriales bacterium]
MKPIALITGLLYGVLAVFVVIYHQGYTTFFDKFDLPGALSHTLYRVILIFCIVESIRFIILATYRPQGNARRDNFTIGVSHLAKVSYALLAGVLILSLFNITVKEAITTLSLIAAAIVLMTKDYISNLINGMYLTFAKVVNIGDSVEIAEKKGKILDITLTNVHLLNDDDDIIYIPNNKVFSSEIINYTRRELKRSNVDFEINVDYVPQVEWLEQEIENSLGELKELIQPGTMILKVQSIKQEYTTFKFQYILIDPLNKEQDKKVKRHVIRLIVRLITELRTARKERLPEVK